MALGATSIDILRLIGAQGAALVGAGLLLVAARLKPRPCQVKLEHASQCAARVTPSP
jgi:hypothetical protein